MEIRVKSLPLPSRLDPYPLHLAHAHIIVAPVVKSGCLSVRMPGHALRDLNATTVDEVISNPGRAEDVAAYRGFNSGVGSTAARHVPDIGARYRALPYPSTDPDEQVFRIRLLPQAVTPKLCRGYG